MVDRKEFDMLPKKEIAEEIMIRKELLSKMLGKLYPSILQDEINTLTELYNQKVREES